MRPPVFTPHFLVPAFFALVLGACGGSDPPILRLPPRPTESPTGSDVARTLRGLSLEDREARIVAEVVSGNVPDWLRRLHPVEVTGILEGRRRTITFWVTPDYLAVGSDADFFRTPLSAGTARRIAERVGASLPTPGMVDAIWSQAQVRLGPTPIPPDRFMTTVPVFEDHHRKVQRQRERAGMPPGALVAGHKKDVVLTPRLADRPGRVAIYGWHHLRGDPIQPLYLGHTDDWVDYSHGIRLVADSMSVDGRIRAITDVLADPEIAELLGDEGPIDPDG